MPEAPYATKIPWFTFADLDEDQRALHATFVATRRPGIADDDGRMVGPFNFMLLHPRLSTVLEELGAQLRFRGVLAPQAMEVVVLLVAHAERSPFIGRAHASHAIAQGLDPDRVEALLDTGSLDGLDGAVLVVGTLAVELLAGGEASDEAYAAACDAVGTAGVLEVIVLVNHYRMVAMGLRMFGAPGGVQHDGRQDP